MRFAGKRIAVIGGTGFIGSHLVERLALEGAETLALARTDRHRSNLALVEGKFRLAICDIMDQRAITAIMRDFRPEIVFHLACHPDGAESFSQIKQAMEVNAMGVAHLLDASSSAGASVFVLADSVKVFGNNGAPAQCESKLDPLCSYAIAKSAAWHLCRLQSMMTGISVVGLRPTFVYGRRQNWNLVRYVLDCIRRGSAVKLQGGWQTRDPLHVSDAVEAFLRAAVTPGAHGSSIPIGGGNELTITDMCRAVLGAACAPNQIEVAAEEPRLTEIWRSFADNEDASRLLGWRPQVSFTDGLAELCASQADVSTSRIQAAVA